MATLNFVGFINERVNLTAEQKQVMLADFCESFSPAGSPVIDEQQFANERIAQFITSRVHGVRRTRVTIVIEELSLEEPDV